MDTFLSPSFSPSGQAFFRVAYGVLLLMTLLLALPQSRRFFLTERYGGYAKSGPATDPVQNPVVMPIALAVWLLCAVLLIVGQLTVLAALVNLLLCRYFFIFMRWRGILRGMGAPGFMTHWLAGCVFFLEYALHFEPTGTLRSLVVLVFQLDLAVIMFSSGLYKVLAGYHKGRGMQLGMVNPMWGHWAKLYEHTPPGNAIFKFLNQCAYLNEFLFAILVLIPATRGLGAFVLIASFFFVTTQIRLWVLSEMVMLAPLIYYGVGSPVDDFFQALMGPQTVVASTAVPPIVNAALAVALIVYIGLLPLAHAGLYYNFLARKSLPPLFQGLLERYTNAFGMIIWRVFTADLVSFFIRVYVEDPRTGASTLWSTWGGLDRRHGFRYSHVGESICVTSIFTTLKYYPSNGQIFRERLLRYAHTIPCPPDALLRFEYVSILETAREFQFVPVAEWVVDPRLETIKERILDERAPIKRADIASRVFEGGRPGSYAPLASAGAGRS